MTKKQDQARDPWEDVDVQEEHAQATPTFPFIQWINGNTGLKRVHEVLASGGFGMPVEQFAAASADGVVPDSFASGPIIHKGGKETDAFLTNQLSVAVLATRFRWMTLMGGQSVYHNDYRAGARGKMQALVLVEDFDTLTPVMLTFSGLATRYFNNTLNAFRQQVVAPASALAKKKFPLYAFWMPVEAGDHVEVGQQGAASFITPPVPGWDTEAVKNTEQRRELLRSLFVGQEALDRAATLWNDAQAWAERWKNVPDPAAPAAEAGVEEPNGEAAEAEEIPF